MHALLFKAKKPKPVDQQSLARSFAHRFKTQFAKGQTSTKLLADYQALINNIKKQGYTIIGIKYPLNPTYIKMIQQSPVASHLDNEIDSLATANGIKVIDFSDYIKDDKYFSNADHVNDEGSAVFINKFKEIIAADKKYALH